MSGGPCLEHWTADTGQLRRSPRSEVGTAAIEALAPMIRARAGFVPGSDGWRWLGWTQGTALGWRLVAPGGSECLRCAASPGGDRTAWEATAKAATMPGGIDPARTPAPSGPWLMAALRPGAAGFALSAEWWPDFSRRLAWAWIEADGTARRR